MPDETAPRRERGGFLPARGRFDEPWCAPRWPWRGLRAEKCARRAEKCALRREKSGFAGDKGTFAREKRTFARDKSCFAAEKSRFVAAKSGLLAGKERLAGGRTRVSRSRSAGRAATGAGHARQEAGHARPGAGLSAANTGCTAANLGCSRANLGCTAAKMALSTANSAGRCCLPSPTLAPLRSPLVARLLPGAAVAGRDRRASRAVHPGRATFQPHPLDGAMLYFHPATGVHVRVETEQTRGLARRAPRVVMFGITNACNLRCGFCSRDAGRPSSWTVDTAASVLEGLAQAGTLEVAFGGGEPLAFRGFEELVARLRATTPLALHVTTNGTLLDAPLLARSSRAPSGRCASSIYDDEPWRPAAHLLAGAGQLWGANVLVHDRALATLPGLLARLHALGARDVSLLSYVGPRFGHEALAGRRRRALRGLCARARCRAACPCASGRAWTCRGSWRSWTGATAARGSIS